MQPKRPKYLKPLDGGENNESKRHSLAVIKEKRS